LVAKNIFRLLKIVFSAFLIGFLLYRIGIGRIAEHLAGADPLWLVAAVVVFLLSHFAGSFQWFLLLQNHNVKIRWAKVLSFYFVGLFLNNFLLSNLGGDIFRMADIKRYSDDLSGAVSTVFLDRLSGFFLLSTLAVLLSPWIIIRSGFNSELTVLIVILIFLWTVLLFTLFSKRFARPFAFIVKKIMPESLSLKAKEIYQNIYTFGRQGKIVGQVILLSLVIQSLRILTHYVLARSLGVNVSPAAFFIIVPVIAIAASLPVSFGGIGIREQTGIILFALVGISEVKAFSIEFMAYLIAIISSVPGGIIFITRKGVNKGNN